MSNILNLNKGDVCAFINSQNDNNGTVFEIVSGPFMVDETDRMSSSFEVFYKTNKIFEMSCGRKTKYIPIKQIMKLKF